IFLVPLRTPVMTTGISPRSLSIIRDPFNQYGLVPMQGGAVSANIPADERNISLAPGSAVSVALITGDFDMSAIGTVTHIDGTRDRVPDLLPVSATVLREPEGKAHTYNVKVARLRPLLGQFVHMSLANAVDMEGNFPDEMSARIKARIEIDGQEPLVLDDWFA